jgi:hypothetical protein
MTTPNAVQRIRESTARGTSTSSGATRHALALAIVSLSVIGITLAAALAIWLADPNGRPEMARLVFASVLPLFGTWVGTVLAFYFARDNLQAATDSTIRLSGRLEPATPVQQVMIPASRIVAYVLKPGEDVNALRLTTLYDQMKVSKRQRIPILDASQAVLYVVHESTIHSFADSVTKNADDPAVFIETVADLLLKDEYKKAIAAIGIVGPNAVLAEARAAMRSIENCNDVFVTAHGQKTDPIMGWLTNTDLAGLE